MGRVSLSRDKGGPIVSPEGESTFFNVQVFACSYLLSLLLLQIGFQASLDVDLQDRTQIFPSPENRVTVELEIGETKSSDDVSRAS
jgi:hypothetical protein